jgi:hypothetical protein
MTAYAMLGTLQVLQDLPKQATLLITVAKQQAELKNHSQLYS